MLCECDAAMERHLQVLSAQMEPPTTPLPPRRTKPQSHGKEPRFNIRGYLYHLTGTDLSQIDGIGPYHALRLISEIGTLVSGHKSKSRNWLHVDSSGIASFAREKA